MNYCHACKLFCANKAKFQEHRFSIAHKRTMTELEKPFEEKKEREKEAKERKKERAKEEEKKEEPEASKEEEKKAQIAEDKFKVALKEEIGQGLIDLERKDDKVIITVGSGGAFKSGSADLTNKAKKIMAKIAEVNEKGRSEILVSGHTDNKPLTFGSIYRDNWDLAAARSSSVVQELASTGKLQPDRMKEPCHYIFHCKNPVNDLEYGHGAVLLYNKELTMKTDKPGLDFTLSQAHEVVPILSAVNHFNETPWLAWRTAFREVVKLCQSVPTVESRYRLKKWCQLGKGKNADWVSKGANDAKEFYNKYRDNYDRLMLSYNFEWLKQHYEQKYQNTVC